jgi:hypothetical protein
MATAEVPAIAASAKDVTPVLTVEPQEPASSPVTGSVKRSNGVYELGMTPPYSVVTGVQLGVCTVLTCVHVAVDGVLTFCQFGVCVVITSTHSVEYVVSADAAKAAAQKAASPNMGTP